MLFLARDTDHREVVFLAVLLRYFGNVLRCRAILEKALDAREPEQFALLRGNFLDCTPAGFSVRVPCTWHGRGRLPIVPLDVHCSQ